MVNSFFSLTFFFGGSQGTAKDAWEGMNLLVGNLGEEVAYRAAFIRQRKDMVENYFEAEKLHHQTWVR